jgi:hypothetical protein
MIKSQNSGCKESDMRGDPPNIIHSDRPCLLKPGKLKSDAWDVWPTVGTSCADSLGMCEQPVLSCACYPRLTSVIQSMEGGMLIPMIFVTALQ